MQSLKLTDAELIRFNEITKEINSSLKLDDLLDKIIEICKSFFLTEGASLLLIDEVKNELYFNNAIDVVDGKIKEIRVPMGKGVAGEVAVSGKPLIVNDPNDSRIYKEADKQTSNVTRNLLCVPLRVKKKIIGVLELINTIEKENFDESDLALFSLFSDYAAIAINNRELLDASDLQVRQLKSIYHLSQIVSQSDSVTNLANSALELISKNTSSKRVSIILKEPLTGEFYFFAGKGVDEGVLRAGEVTIKENVLSYVQEARGPVLCNNMKEDGRFGSMKKLRYSTDKFICVPLFYKDEVMGFIGVTERPESLIYKQSDLSLVQTIAKEFIDGYHLMVIKSQIEEKKILDLEVEVTAQLQDDILPKSFPKYKNVDISADCIPAKKVGGDYYDLIKLEKNEFMVLISDISGKGIPSTVFMAICRSILRMTVQEGNEPRHALKKSNEYIYDNSRSGMFSTTFMAKINVVERKMTFSSAGHMEQLYYSYKTDKVQKLYLKGKPLGVLEKSKYQDKSISFGKRDVLVLFTDGITEATNRRKQEYGLERLQELLKKNHHLSAGKLNKAIIKDVKDFIDGSNYIDDLTLVVLKF